MIRPPSPGNIARGVPHDPEEGWVVLSRGERNPLGFVDMIGEGGRTAELGPAIGDLLPKRPGTAVGLALEDWCGVHGSQAGSLRHRSQGDDDVILRASPDLVRCVRRARNECAPLAALRVLAKAEISDAVFNSNRTPCSSSHFCERPDHRVVLVVDGSHDPAERVEARRPCERTAPDSA